MQYFWAYRLWLYSLTKPDFFRFGVIFRACSLQNEVGDPPFFYIFDITKLSSYTGKSLRKKSMLEHFRANVLKEHSRASNFLGGMPPEPPSGSRLWRSKFASSCSKVWLRPWEKSYIVEPVLGGHPRGTAKWPLNTEWMPNTGCKNNISNKASPEKAFDLKLETLIFGVLMIYENKHGNQLLHLECYIIWNYMNK